MDVELMNEESTKESNLVVKGLATVGAFTVSAPGVAVNLIGRLGAGIVKSTSLFAKASSLALAIPFGSLGSFVAEDLIVSGGHKTDNVLNAVAKVIALPGMAIYLGGQLVGALLKYTGKGLQLATDVISLPFILGARKILKSKNKGLYENIIDKVGLSDNAKEMSEDILKDDWFDRFDLY